MRKFLITAAIVLSLPVSAALAVVGTPPGTGPALQDGVWLNGLAGGLNWLSQSGVSAAGTNQATCTALNGAVELLEIDTAAASTGACLPTAVPGTELKIYNNGAQTVTIYTAVANNPVTAAQDTINNSTSKTIAQHVSVTFWCAKAGVWAAQ